MVDPERLAIPNTRCDICGLESATMQYALNDGKHLFACNQKPCVDAISQAALAIHRGRRAVLSSTSAATSAKPLRPQPSSPIRMPLDETECALLDELCRKFRIRATTTAAATARINSTDHPRRSCTATPGLADQALSPRDGKSGGNATDWPKQPSRRIPPQIRVSEPPTVSCVRLRPHTRPHVSAFVNTP